MKVFDAAAVADAPANFLHKAFRSKDLADHRLTIQVAPDDCTGCGVCVDVCPAKSKTDVSHKAINMEPAMEHRDVEREDRKSVVKGKSVSVPVDLGGFRFIKHTHSSPIQSDY